MDEGESDSAGVLDWGSFTVLLDKNQQNLRSILETATKANAAAGSNERKIGDFYASCMDTAAIDAAGVKPIEEEMLRIAQMKGAVDLQAEMAHLQSIGVDAMFRFGSRQDAKDSTQVIATAVQGGLGLPDRDYYTRDDDKSKKLRDDYAKHVAKMFELAGDAADKSAAEATTVMTIETTLAKASMSNVERRDPNKTYHRMKLAELKTLTPDFSWENYFAATGHARLTETNVGQPDFFKALDCAVDVDAAGGLEDVSAVAAARYDGARDFRSRWWRRTLSFTERCCAGQRKSSRGGSGA